MSTVTAMTECMVMRLEKTSIIRVLRDQPSFSEIFISHLLARTIRVEEDLVDQLFNSSEKRLARLLLLLANFWQRSEARTDHRKDQSGDACGDDRHDTVSRQLLHEQISTVGVRRLQRRRPGSSQLIVERGSARLSAVVRPKIELLISRVGAIHFRPVASLM